MFSERVCDCVQLLVNINERGGLSSNKSRSFLCKKYSMIWYDSWPPTTPKYLHYSLFHYILKTTVIKRGKNTYKNVCKTRKQILLKNRRSGQKIHIFGGLICETNLCLHIYCFSFFDYGTSNNSLFYYIRIYSYNTM